MRFTPLFFALALLASSAAAQKKISVPFVTISIDGNVAEWNDIPALTPSRSPIVLKAARDSTYLYLYVWFSDRRSYTDAQQYGFTIFAEHPKAPKRSFSITLPTGLVNELAAFPGARRGYLSDPNWVSEPGNRKILERIDEDLHTHALLGYRKTKEEQLIKWPIPFTQLNAMDLLIRNDPAIPTAAEYRIPLQTSRVRQFGADVKPTEVLRLGFEIRPPDVQELMQEQSGLNPGMGGMDRVGRNAAGPNQRGFMASQDQMVQGQQLMMLQMGAFEKWFLVKAPAKPN